MEQKRMTDSSSAAFWAKYTGYRDGIADCLERLAHLLIVDGVDGFYRAADEASDSSKTISLRNHWCYLRRGVDELGKSRIESAILPLRKPYERMKDLTEKHRLCVESIEKAEEQWSDAAERARRQLEVWETWAIDTEIEWRKNVIPKFGSDTFWGLSVGIKIRGASWCLASSRALRDKVAFFEDKVNRIRDIIDRAYFDAKLPNDLSVDDFEAAVNDLMRCQVQINRLSNNAAELENEFKCVSDACQRQKRDLGCPLALLPDTARLALFPTLSSEFAPLIRIASPKSVLRLERRAILCVRGIRTRSKIERCAQNVNHSLCTAQ
jgi:hypothetical protein